MYRVVELYGKGFQLVCANSFDARDSLVYHTQATSFSLGRNTQSEWVWISQTRHVLHYARHLSSTNFRSKRGSSLLSGYMV